MGVPVSKDNRDQYKKNKEIESEINKEKIDKLSVVKLLLLGAAESGKSTILKQMKILHNNGFTDDDLLSQRDVIYANILQSMAALLQAMDKLSIKFADSERECDANHILSTVNDVVPESKGSRHEFLLETVTALRNLWTDAGVQRCFQRNNEFQIHDSAKYFLDNLDRISHPNYMPTQDDVLRARVATTGIIYVDFFLKGLHFKVCDVGGQRSERKKWIHCFDDVNSIVFVASLSEYDQVLMEDEKTNRMVESIRLFYSICNSEFFLKAAILLFLNKKDIFEEKLKKSSLKIAFPEYKGNNQFNEAANYVQEQYRKQKENHSKQMYVHYTCATDTQQVKFVLDSSIETIISQNLKGSGLVN